MTRCYKRPLVRFLSLFICVMAVGGLALLLCRSAVIWADQPVAVVASVSKFDMAVDGDVSYSALEEKSASTLGLPAEDTTNQ